MRTCGLKVGANLERPMGFEPKAVVWALQSSQSDDKEKTRDCTTFVPAGADRPYVTYSQC